MCIPPPSGQSSLVHFGEFKWFIADIKTYLKCSKIYFFKNDLLRENVSRTLKFVVDLSTAGCGTVVSTWQLRYGHIYSNATTTPASKMAASVFETCHVACCANRTPNVVSWGRGGTIAFGTCNSVALYDPQVAEYVYSLL